MNLKALQALVFFLASPLEIMPPTLFAAPPKCFPPTFSLIFILLFTLSSRNPKKYVQMTLRTKKVISQSSSWSQAWGLRTLFCQVCVVVGFGNPISLVRYHIVFADSRVEFSHILMLTRWIIYKRNESDSIFTIEFLRSVGSVFF